MARATCGSVGVAARVSREAHAACQNARTITRGSKLGRRRQRTPHARTAHVRSIVRLDRALKNETETPDEGADAKPIRGLFKVSRKGQDWFQRFLFAPSERSPVQARMFDALVSVAQRTDRWLADRAPAT